MPYGGKKPIGFKNSVSLTHFASKKNHVIAVGQKIQGDAMLQFGFRLYPMALALVLGCMSAVNAYAQNGTDTDSADTMEQPSINPFITIQPLGERQTAEVLTLAFRTRFSNLTEVTNHLKSVANCVPHIWRTVPHIWRTVPHDIWRMVSHMQKPTHTFLYKNYLEPTLY